jgi:Domain of unknown function (DUF4386)
MATTAPIPRLPATITDIPEGVQRSLRRPALVAGLGLLVMAVLAGAANAGIQNLVTESDATRTAHDILAAQGWFRLAAAALFVAAVLDIVVAWALREFFAPVHTGLATLAAWLRLCYAGVFAVAITQLVQALHLLHNAQNLSTESTDQRHTAALLKIHTFQDIWHIGLVLFGLHLVLIGYLAYRSGYVPRVLGGLLVIVGAGYLLDSVVRLLVATYSGSVATFTGIGEVAFMLWLLLKGRNVTLNR